MVSEFSFGVIVYGYYAGRGGPTVAVVMAAFLALVAAATGCGDASWGYAVARGQRIQFIVVAVLTVSTFTIVYLIAYYTGRRWPLRRTQFVPAHDDPVATRHHHGRQPR